MGKKKQKHRRQDSWEDDYEVKPELDDKSSTRLTTKVEMAYILDKDEVNKLIAASNAPYPEQPQVHAPAVYPTYSEYEAVALINGNYKPKKTKKKK